MPARIPLDRDRLAAFCQRWRIREFALFGSVLRADFRADSNVDVLVSFAPAPAPGPAWGLRDYVQMEDELAAILGRRVDLVERRLVETSPNYIKRQAILASLEHLDVAG